jgi:primosomal protein N' (replication factor Y)
MIGMMPSAYAQVVLDIPSRALDAAFVYRIPDDLREQTRVGCCVLVDFARRPSLGYVIGVRDTLSDDLEPEKIKPLREVLSASYFDETSAQLAQWIAREYLAPLSETLHLFTPPGSSPRLKKDAEGNWRIEHPGVGPVDDRWVSLTKEGGSFVPKAHAVKQRAIIEALGVSEMRVTDLALEISSLAAPLKALERRGVIRVESRRRIRGSQAGLPSTRDIEALTSGQAEALALIKRSLSAQATTRITAQATTRATLTPKNSAPRTTAQATARTTSVPSVQTPAEEGARPILLDGVTGSGKTEVYLQAIRAVLQQGGSALVLVPEISLTPQTVARFRARFGEQVAVLHSRLSAGERFDQWDLVRTGIARVVVGARSALFAPARDLRVIIIDEEHEATYKQSSSPRYVTRDVAAQLAQLRNATLVLGSATPSMETLHAVETGAYLSAELPERASGKPLPPIQVVDLSAQFHAGNKTMFSQPLRDALLETISCRQKAVLLLNKRGFASFLLCRDCGYVPMCDDCATSLTYHERPSRLMCHHCGMVQSVPPVCPECGSPYLKQLGPGTQFAADQLKTILPEDTPIVRMDADTTRGKGGHEHCLDEFMAAPYGVLLGTQMIAKGLDFPEVTLVGVLIADTALKFPDFRAPERTYQLLEQVAGRAGRAEKDGRVIVQTYWPEHVAIRAAATHDRELLLADERAARLELGYPPYARLANILLWGKDFKAVSREAMKFAERIEEVLDVDEDVDGGVVDEDVDVGGNVDEDRNVDGGVVDRDAVDRGTVSSTSPSAHGIHLLGPSPCVLARRQGNYRWHILIKAPFSTDLPGLLGPVIRERKATPGINVAVDIDPLDLL